MMTINASFRRAAERSLRALVVCAFAATAAACGDDPSEGDDDDVDPAALRITVTPASGGAAQTFTLRASGTSDPVVFRVGTSTISAVALDDRNQTIALPSDYELRLVQSVTFQGANEVENPLTGGLTFTRNGGLSGATLTATTASTTARTAVARVIHDDHTHFDASFSYTVAP